MMRTARSGSADGDDRRVARACSVTVRFNTTQTASISIASRVPYLQHADGDDDRTVARATERACSASSRCARRSEARRNC